MALWIYAEPLPLIGFTSSPKRSQNASTEFSLIVRFDLSFAGAKGNILNLRDSQIDLVSLTQR